MRRTTSDAAASRGGASDAPVRLLLQQYTTALVIIVHFESIKSYATLRKIYRPTTRIICFNYSSLPGEMPNV